MNPYIGAIVHYVPQSRGPSRHLAAIVTNDAPDGHGPGYVNLRVIFDHDSDLQYISLVRFDDAKSGNTWHWPEEQGSVALELKVELMQRELAECEAVLGRIAQFIDELRKAAVAANRFDIDRSTSGLQAHQPAISALGKTLDRLEQYLLSVRATLGLEVALKVEPHLNEIDKFVTEIRRAAGNEKREAPEDAI